MEEIKKINVEHEIMGLQYYIEAMQKHEKRKATLEDLGNLMIHVNNLKAWAGITDTEQQSNCNLPQVMLPYPLSSAHELWQMAREMSHDEFVSYYNTITKGMQT